MTFSAKKSQHPYMQTAGLITGGATLLLAALAYKYPDRPMFTEARDGLLAPDAYPLVGITPTVLMRRHTIHDYMLELAERYNVLTGTGIGLGIPRLILTIDPKVIDHVLRNNFENYIKGSFLDDAMGELFGKGIFNADGEVWRYQRKAASHIFNVKNFRDGFTTVFSRNIRTMKSDVFNPAAQTQLPLDFHDAMHNFTLGSFLEVSFGIPPDILTKEALATFCTSFDVCQRNVAERIMNPACRTMETLESWLMPWRTSIHQHLANVNDFAMTIVAKRREEIAANDGKAKDDLLSRFMNTKNNKDQPLSDKELRDIVLNFIIAGRDTTAQAISWMMYMLLTNPGVRYALLAEINDTITDDIENDPAAMFEAVKKMKYANAVFREVLRLHPPVPANVKVALKDDVWPDGSTIKKGDLIGLITRGVGRSEMVWGKDAKKFKPDRWFADDGSLRLEPPSKWPAFNAGPRTCIGQVLGTAVALITITSLLRRYEFKLVPDQEITYQVGLTLPMKNGMKVYVNCRK